MATQGSPEDFNSDVARKYNILQQQADAQTKLEGAQAAALSSRSPFENELLKAQASQADATAGTIQPLANASIGATTAGIGETQARTGLIGAQTTDLQQGQGAIGVLGSRYFRDLLQRGGTTFAPSGGAGAGGPGVTDIKSIVPQGPVPASSPTATPGSPVPAAAGASSGRIQTQGGGSGYYDGNGNYVPGFAGGTSMVKGPMKFAMGGDVPAPGQTVTNGSWTGPTTPAPPPPPLPASPMTGADLRARLGLGVPRGYAKGTARVRGNPSTMPMAPTPGNPAMAAGGLPGLSGMLQAAMGATKVPGRGSGKVDTVHAMLAPGEAVVNKAAVKHIPGGRPAIAKANAKGAAEMGGKPTMVKSPVKGKAAPPPRSMGSFTPGAPPPQQGSKPKAKMA